LRTQGLIQRGSLVGHGLGALSIIEFIIEYASATTRRAAGYRRCSIVTLLPARLRQSIRPLIRPVDRKSVSNEAIYRRMSIAIILKSPRQTRRVVMMMIVSRGITMSKANIHIIVFEHGRQLIPRVGIIIRICIRPSVYISTIQCIANGARTGVTTSRRCFRFRCDGERLSLRFWNGTGGTRWPVTERAASGLRDIIPQVCTPHITAVGHSRGRFGICNNATSRVTEICSRRRTSIHDCNLSCRNVLLIVGAVRVRYGDAVAGRV